MVILTVYIHHIKVKYKSTLLSKATFFVGLCAMLSIVLPFIFAYKSGGFWLKHDVFYEQPRINLKGDYLVIAETNNLSNAIICSTFPYHKENLDFLDVCSMIRLREIDENFDGKIDMLSLNISINTLQCKVTSINIILPINYKVDTVCPIRMQSAIIFQQSFQTGVKCIKIVGDLSVYQSSPIQCFKKGVHDLYNYPVVGNGDELEDVFEKYMKRNMSTHLSNVYTRIYRGKSDKFDINLSVRYPEHKIHYNTSFWHVMKWAWMQYFAIYIIIAWIVSGIKRYIFNNRLVLYYKDHSTEKYKQD